MQLHLSVAVVFLAQIVVAMESSLKDCLATFTVGPTHTCEVIAQSCLVPETLLAEMNPKLSPKVCKAGAPLTIAGDKICCDIPRRNAQTIIGTESLIAATLGLPTINSLLFRGFSMDCVKANSRAIGEELMTV